MPLPIEETISQLAGDHPLLNSKLAELSNLSSADLDFFKNSWPAIETKRRRQIVYRLVEMAEDNIELNFDSILKYCLQDQDDEVQSRAIEGLWENEEASLISPLINLLNQDSTDKIQAVAATALGKFSMLAEHEKLRSCYVSQIEAALLAVINNENQAVEVRRRALEAAAPLNLPQVKTAIMEAYHSHNSRLKVSSIYAMGKNCDPSWLPILLKELASTDTEICYEAAGSCGELGDEEAVSHLIKLVDNPDTDVQMAAIQALGKIGGTQAKECLELYRDNTSEVIRQAAEQALNELEGKESSYLFDATALNTEHD